MEQISTAQSQLAHAYEYPFAETKACYMVRTALKKAAIEKGWSQRYISGLLGYKNSVVLSHVASGRIQASIDRAIDYSRVLDMDAGEYLLAVLEQRHPEINFKSLFQIDDSGEASLAVTPPAPCNLTSELNSIAGRPIDELPMPSVKVLRAVVADAAPQRRWLEPHEIAFVAHIRKVRPDGLSANEHLVLAELIS